MKQESKNSEVQEHLFLDEKKIIIGKTELMQKVLRQVEQVAPTKATVLITGETGVGKDVIAQAIHNKSPRKKLVFKAVNCGAFYQDLLQSELFGHERGSFTGATSQRRGVFEQADGGTLFLDEVGEMSPEVQVKFLRVLETQEFTRLGGEKNIKVDVRIIAATNIDLATSVRQKKFRRDLYYRLNLFRIHIPPLHDRREDIPTLVDTFISELSKEHTKTITGITPEALNHLQEYDWPGNIRELRNAVERLVIVSPENTEVQLEDVTSLIKELQREDEALQPEDNTDTTDTEDEAPQPEDDTSTTQPVNQDASSQNQELYKDLFSKYEELNQRLISKYEELNQRLIDISSQPVNQDASLQNQELYKDLFSKYEELNQRLISKYEELNQRLIDISSQPVNQDASSQNQELYKDLFSKYEELNQRLIDISSQNQKHLEALTATLLQKFAQSEGTHPSFLSEQPQSGNMSIPDETQSEAILPNADTAARFKNALNMYAKAKNSRKRGYNVLKPPAQDPGRVFNTLVVLLDGKISIPDLKNKRKATRYRTDEGEFDFYSIGGLKTPYEKTLKPMLEHFKQKHIDFAEKLTERGDAEIKDAFDETVIAQLKILCEGLPVTGAEKTIKDQDAEHSPT